MVGGHAGAHGKEGYLNDYNRRNEYAITYTNII